MFVFAVTQVSAFLHDDPSFGGLGRGALLLLMLWWTWSLYTWTTNWTGTDRLGIRLSLIGSMGGGAGDGDRSPGGVRIDGTG